ncbi:3-phosphoserine/phosphohydroxythreonine transaminase [Paenibacillus psychroresistens]|uniref:Phosphoserine aminotransferase n=1 Tax=Paenibacillus psychroresistens TaxID=1778678 RepID=A0A6B8RLK0_9BACL|nr:3-phosphoserine/phosphohydroxythreonine transaminase [Paenibacillus psychroresistens]QGQ96737.1 3-phosphoserine/phosphohydroxythreonine transaminase [Paenibacillus psychroresistens]
MAERLFNFNAGPAALPLEVLMQAQEEFVDYQNGGISLLEMSHRHKRVEEMNQETQALLLELMNLKKGYHVLFMGGGASSQFALIPLNLLQQQQFAAYALSGSFSEKAYQEAKYVGEARIIASSKDQNWSQIPQLNTQMIEPDCSYVHITSNNTIEGSRYNSIPQTNKIPLIADMTSDILSRKLDFDKFAMIYAGAQKNLGPAGVTTVIIHEDLLQNASKQIPLILRYETFVKNQSLYNTPPVHAIYMMNLMLKWAVKQGGIGALEQQNKQKAKRVYEVIDNSNGFYQGFIDLKDRSDMNITWRMSSEELEQQFVNESLLHGFEGLAGHRSIGGLRASAYNAVPLKACQALAEFMIEFQRQHE